MNITSNVLESSRKGEKMYMQDDTLEATRYSQHGIFVGGEHVQRVAKAHDLITSQRKASISRAIEMRRNYKHFIALDCSSRNIDVEMMLLCSSLIPRLWVSQPIKNLCHYLLGRITSYEIVILLPVKVSLE